MCPSRPVVYDVALELASGLRALVRETGPAEMGAAEVTAFLTSLAVHDKVAASTQNQALSAPLFLYREVLGVELPWRDDVVRAKRPLHLPAVLTRDEVRAVLPRLMAGEGVDDRALAGLGHGGLLSRDMAFRFPPYRANAAQGELE